MQKNPLYQFNIHKVTQSSAIVKSTEQATKPVVCIYCRSIYFSMHLHTSCSLGCETHHQYANAIHYSQPLQQDNSMVHYPVAEPACKATHSTSTRYH